MSCEILIENISIVINKFNNLLKIYVLHNKRKKSNYKVDLYIIKNNINSSFRIQGN